jgi:hypothetical protein
MRNMTSLHFCPVCYEGMWMQFFARISAIDDVTVTCDDKTVIQLHTGDKSV